MSQKAEKVVRELDALRATLCAVGVVGVIEGYPTIRRESVIELVDRARAEIGSMAQTTHTEQSSSTVDSASDVIDVHQHHVGIRIDGHYYGLAAVRRALAAEHQRLLAARSPDGQPGEETRC